jgi:predicted glycogen debranching enzyme
MPLYSIETYSELKPHLDEEWLITNGLGGMASSSVVGCNTRRYHGLLCAATLPPVGRMMLLNRIGEAMIVDGKTDHLLEFSVNQFGNLFFPRGDQYLRRFDLEDAVAQWDFNVEGVHIVKQLQMPWLKNATGIRYQIEPNGKHVELWLSPFVRLLDFHALRRGKASFDEKSGQRDCSIKAGDNTQLHITADAGKFEAKPDWWFGHTYAIESERGQDDTEDLYTPGRFIFTTDQPATITLWASHDTPATFDWEAEASRRRAVAAGARRYPPKVQGPTAPPRIEPPESPTIQRLMHAANDFIVYRKSPDGKPGTSVIAGYPWFADWGPARPFADHRPIRSGPASAQRLRAIRQPGDDPQSFRRLHERAILQHGRCQPLVHPRGVRIRQAFRRHRNTEENPAARLSRNHRRLHAWHAI